MALQPQVKPVSLFGSIDTKTDPKYVAADKLLRAENVRFGAVQGVKKRYGQTRVSNRIGSDPADLITTGKALGVRQNELLAFDGSALYGYATAQDRWFSRGALTETLLETNAVAQSSGSVEGVASLYVGDVEFYAWEDSRGGVYYAARDRTSLGFVLPPALLNVNASNPQVIACGAYIYLFYATATELRAEQFIQQDLSRGSIASYILFSGTVSPTYNYAVACTVDSILYAFSDGTTITYRGYTPDLVLDTVDGAEYQSAAYANGTSPLVMAYNDYTQASTWVLAFQENATTNIRIVADSYGDTGAVVGQATGVIAAGVTVDTIRFAPRNATEGYLYYSYTSGGKVRTVQVLLTVNMGSFTVTAGEVTRLYDLEIASGGNGVPDGTGNQTPYIVLRSPLTNLLGDTSQQTSYFLVGGMTMAVLQRFYGAEAYGSGIALPLMSYVDGALFVGLTKRTALRADIHGTVYAQTGLFACNFEFPTTSATQVIEFADSALINCGNTYVYDGASLIESGFWEFPDGISASAYAASSGLSTGLYAYCVTYEWTDASGRVHISAPSYPSPVTSGSFGITVAAGDNVVLTVPFLALTKKTGVQVCIYRNAVNSPGPFYKVTSVANTTAGTASFVYTDFASDATIQSQQLLYAPPDGSGELENDPAPPFRYMVATKTRAFGVPQDDPTALWYSKPLAPGRPVEWSALQVVQIETAGGDVTALSFLDTQAVVFKRKRIYVLPGNGPNAAGQPANGFPAILTAVPATSGCINAKSVLAVAEGIYYQSEFGLEQLNRSLQVTSAFGAAVQGLTSALTLTGAAISADQNQLRWSTSDGTALIYDYVVQRWSTYTNYAAVGFTSWNDTAARLTAAGRVYYEDTDTYLDNGLPVTMLVETSWLKPAEMAQGFAAVWYATILGTYIDSHQLVIQAAYDYIDAPVQQGIWDAATNSLGTFGSGSPYGSDPVFGANQAVYSTRYQPRIALQRQVCEAVKFTIYDTVITGASCDLNEIALSLGVIGGTKRVPSAQQV